MEGVANFGGSSCDGMRFVDVLPAHKDQINSGVCWDAYIVGSKFSYIVEAILLA